MFRTASSCMEDGEEEGARVRSDARRCHKGCNAGSARNERRNYIAPIGVAMPVGKDQQVLEHAETPIWGHLSAPKY